MYDAELPESALFQEVFEVCLAYLQADETLSEAEHASREQAALYAMTLLARTEGCATADRLHQEVDAWIQLEQRAEQQLQALSCKNLN